MKQATGLLLLSALLFMGGCSSVEYNSTNSPRMIVKSDRTPFFHNGPAQGNGPDLSLIKGDTVEVLRKEIGYSFVRIEDGQNGYVANEALEPAPKTTAPAPAATSVGLKPSQNPAAPAANAPSTNQAVKPTFRY